MAQQGFKAGSHGYVASDAKTSSEKSSEVDVSDESLGVAWKDVTNDKTPTNWCAFSFTDSEKSTKLVCVGTGGGGYAELKGKLLSWSSRVVFGAFRVHCTDRIVDNSGTVRPKYVFFTNIGSSVKEYDRAAVNFQKGKVSRFFGSTQLTLDMRGNEVETMYTPKHIAILWIRTVLPTSPLTMLSGMGLKLPSEDQDLQQLPRKMMTLMKILINSSKQIV